MLFHSYFNHFIQLLELTIPYILTVPTHTGVPQQHDDIRDS